MRIEQVVLQFLKMPLKSPFTTSFGTMKEKEFYIIKVFGDGEVGMAESVAMTEPIYNEETNGTILHIMEEFLIPILLNNEISHPSEIQGKFSHIRRNNMAKSALESAVWDLFSRKNNISLSTALGGTRKEIEVGVSVGIQNSIEELIDIVGQFLEDGYKKIKVKIKPGWDIEPIRALRREFGNDFPLMADANSSYTLDEVDLLKELDHFNLIMIEQPLAHDDIIEHAILQKELKTPICLDESIHSVDDARKAIEMGSCKIINIKIGRVGGLTEAKKIHDLCRENNVPVWCGGMLEAGIGRGHNLALASLSNFSIPGDTSSSDRYWEKDIITPDVKMSKPGIIEIPSSVGFGFNLDENVVKQYLVSEKFYSFS